MKKTLLKVFLIMIGIIIIGKISSWLINFNGETKQMLNTGMFTLIGIGFLVMSFIWNKKITKIIFIICGIYLILMNFIGDFDLKSVLGIISIITPFLINRFLPEESEKNELTEN